MTLEEEIIEFVGISPIESVRTCLGIIKFVGSDSWIK